MHDIADLERRGIVGVFLASEVFAQAAQVQGAAIGFAAPHVLVPHPIQDRTDDELAQLADQAYDDVLRAVTTGSPGEGT